MMTSVAKAYISRSMPHSLIIWNARCFVSLGVDHRKADVERTCTVVRSQPLLLQTLDELQRQTLDDDVAFAPEESEQRQTDGHVAAQETAALDEHYFGAFLQSSRLGCHKSRRACAHDQDITSARTGIRRAGSSFCFIFGIG